MKDSCDVHVSKRDTTVHVDGLTVSPKTVELDLGGTSTASPIATISPENATDKQVIWSSSDSEKVMVDSSTCKIIGLKVTDKPVTATSHENSAFKDTISVTVKDPTDHNIHVTSVSLDATAELDLNDEYTDILTATVLPANAGNKKINWTTTDASVVTVEAIGDTSCRITGLTEGTATITGTSDDVESKYASCVVTVSNSRVYVQEVEILSTESEKITEIDINMNDFANVLARVLPTDADEL